MRSWSVPVFFSRWGPPLRLSGFSSRSFRKHRLRRFFLPAPGVLKPGRAAVSLSPLQTLPLAVQPFYLGYSHKEGLFRSLLVPPHRPLSIGPFSCSFDFPPFRDPYRLRNLAERATASYFFFALQPCVTVSSVETLDPDPSGCSFFFRSGQVLGPRFSSFLLLVCPALRA